MPVNIERLFVDLIIRSSEKYPSWDPEVPVHVGDYGHITQAQGKRSTWFRRKRVQGRFVKEGNIYEHGLPQKYDIPEPKEYGASSLEGVTWITSENVQEVGYGVAVGANAATGGCKVQAAFDIASGRGAILAMENDTISTIDPPGRLRDLLDHELRDVLVVSEVHRCSSYARYLAVKGARTVSIALGACDPVSSASASAEARWKCTAKAGNFKSKISKHPEQRDFYPLFRLVSLKESAVSTGLVQH